MSVESDKPLSFACPQCQKKLRAPATLAGKKLSCPKCSSKIQVPIEKAPLSQDDEWLALDEPITSENTYPKAVEKPIASVEPKTKSVFDDDLPELLPIEETASSPSASLDIGLPDIELPDLEPREKNNAQRGVPQAKSLSKGEPKKTKVDILDDFKLEGSALGNDFSVPPNDEFTFPCRICGSLLYALESRSGSSIRCPDCYTELTVPKPVRKKKQPEIKLEEGPTVALQPIEAKNSRRNVPANTDEIMEKASQALDQESRNSNDYSASFDTKRWLELILGFLRDPLVVTAVLGLGLCTGLWFLAIVSMGTWVKLELVHAMIARSLIFGVLFIPIVGAICLCSLCVLTMAANRAPRVTEWPLNRMGDAIGEGVLLIAALIGASVPGGMIGGMMASLNAHPMISSAMIMLGIWAITPILFLSMIDNGSVTEPYSKQIVQSIKQFADAWGAMYMQSAFAFIFIFCLMIVAYIVGPIGSFLLGFSLPFFVFFIINQYGVLAGRISQSTSLGFEGDFSDDSL